MDTLKSLKLWQIGTLVAVLVGTAVATYGVYALIGDSSSSGLGESEQLIPVQYGNLVNQVSTNGSLVFSNRETLTFGVQGTVGGVLVEEGQQVQEGQELARLDQTTVVSLEKAVAQARINLRGAEEALAKALDPHTPLDMAQAEANVANAMLSRKNAQDALDRLLSPTSQDLAQAEAAVANAKLSVEGARDALDRLVSPTSKDIAQAAVAVANAKLSVEGARDALDRLISPTSQDMAQGEVAVANAKISVEDTEGALSSLLETTAKETAQAEGAVTSAKISIKNAQEALESLRSGPTEEDIANAQSQVDSTTTALVNSEGDLSLATREWDAKTETSQGAVDTTLTDYQEVFEKWLGIGPEAIDEGLDPDILLASWGADLDSLFDPASRFLDQGRGLSAEGPPSDDPATPWSEVIVYLWLNAYPGSLVPTCEDIEISSQTSCIKGEIDQAWGTLDSAVDNLDTVETQAAKAITNAEGAVTRAQESLAATQEALADLISGPDPLEIEAKENEVSLAHANLGEAEERLEELMNGANTLQIEANLALARANLDMAQEDLADLENGPDPLELEAKRNQVDVAKANLDKAEEDLGELLNGADQLELEAAKKQTEVAQANLDKAQEDLAALLNGADPLELDASKKQTQVAQATLDKAEEDLAELKSSVDALEVILREAEVASAQLSLDTAVELLETSTLRAPMDGVVSLVNVETGQVVTPNTRVIEIVDFTVVEVDAIVDEIDVLFVQVGAQADVTMDALPGQVLEGVVSSVAMEAQNQQGVVTYPIRIQVGVPEGVQLVEGLSATANIVLREDTNVLLIPVQSIYGTFEQPLVRVMSNGAVKERPVVLGNSDDFWVVVSEGLIEGEQVVMLSSEASTDPFAAIRQQFQAGGRRGPGGLGGGGGGGFGGGGGGQLGR